ncbi:TIGR02680 family protein [Cellulomonas sp.]|uniref:TIGR02680 family protein n=1 Tax=Cellulomonas sp. TaxID=40001 RepID=UPI0025864CC7|nr:TIGR02680 family protein [Cellulomonas sp.]MCR6688822.1 TIGR02680 family protein [Cellulomonas sp.]
MNRWRPARAGICNIWRYYDEVFTFENGRLLLRGPNGSGKSKALELLLPFLLDASTQPSRLSTFGTTSRTMHWNLMGEGATGRTRVGFVWLEMQDDDGERFTIGARLAATKESTRVDPTYFTTNARIGDDLRLLDTTDAPLTVAALAAALDGRGRVHAKAEEYRAAVRERLFPGMSGDRYATLVEALLQLRRPKLSEHLDPETLSSVLSSALPPVDEMQIAELAEGFERLDQQRAQLATLARQEQAAQSLATAARRYAHVVLRDRATALTQATSALEKASGDVRHGETRLDAARTAEAEARTAAESAARHRDELRQARETLERSDVYRHGRALDDLRGRAADARGIADRSRDDLESATHDASNARADADRSLGEAEVLRVTVGNAVRDVFTRADRLLVLAAGADLAAPPRLGEDAAQASEGLDPDGATVCGSTADWAASVGTTLVDVRARAASRRAQVDEVLRLVGGHEAAVDERGRAERLVADAATCADTARAALADATDGLAAAVDAHAASVRGWAESLVVLALDHDDVDRALDRVAEAASEGDVASGDAAPGARHEDLPADLRTLADAARRLVVEDVARRRAHLEQRRDEVRAEQREDRVARDALADATAVEPGRAAWRDAPPVTGAPLWRLVDVHPDTDLVALAGLEAALEAGGLLDAWVQPNGVVTLDGHDVLLADATRAVDGATTEGSPGARHGHVSLLDVLRPDTEQGDVAADVVARILAGVPVVEVNPAGTPAVPVEGDIWVTVDGRWRLGPMHGRWAKPEAQYIGASARERHRRARIAELETRLAALAELLRGLEQDDAQLDARQRAADAEVAALPSDTSVHRSAAAVTTARTQAAMREHDLGVAMAERQSAERLVVERWAAVETSATRAGMPTDRSALTELLDALRTLGDDTDRAGVSVRAYVSSVEAVQRDADRARAAAERLAERTTRAATDEAAAHGLERQVAELDATLGDELRRISNRLEELRGDISAADARAPGLASALERAGKQVAGMEATLATATERHAAAQVEREGAREAMTRMTRTTLTEDAGLDLAPTPRNDEGTVKGDLEIARAVLRLTDQHNETVVAATARMTERRHEVAPTLADRAQLELVDAEDTVVLVAVHGGRRTSVAALRTSLATERARMAGEITDGERALFRRVLTGATRRHLSERIRDADELVRGMNRRLAAVRTASDVQVRLQWEVRDDEGSVLRRARDLLLTNPARLTEDDDRALETFLDERITRARASDDNLPWAQQLARVFDYTQWHQFRVQMTRNDASGWRTLTRRVHSALSGGEKAIALHLPLFAALAAHYEATPGAPRLILLDEVFVGIDTTNRGQVLGLLRDLDLDLVLTSDHEWCAYPQVDGIAIHALAAGDDDDAVTSTRFVWTGTELVEDPAADGMLV